VFELPLPDVQLHSEGVALPLPRYTLRLEIAFDLPVPYICQLDVAALPLPGYSLWFDMVFDLPLPSTSQGCEVVLVPLPRYSLGLEIEKLPLPLSLLQVSAVMDLPLPSYVRLDSEIDALPLPTQRLAFGVPLPSRFHLGLKLLLSCRCHTCEKYAP
jgi:hypothetical protein